ncbi:MAG: T9SS type A sorting domain-containing protein [Chitinophagales bacterium]|nr:T9SS type A sorting domain-containing protein [Chitinophagales bacterium]
MRDGGYLIAAASYDPYNFLSPSMYMIRTNLNGDTLWTKNIRKDEIGLEPIQMRKVSDNRIIIGGNTDCNNGLCHNFFLCLMDTLADTIWIKTYIPTPYHYSIFSDVIISNDKGFLAVGDAAVTDTCSLLIADYGTKAEILKTDPDGNLNWQITTGGDTATFTGAVSAIQTIDGNFMIAGYTSVYDQFEVHDAYLASISESGIVQWEKIYGTFGVYDGLRTIINTSDNNFLAGGYKQDSNHFWKQWIIDVNGNGDEKWDKTFGIDSQQNASLWKTQITYDSQLVYIGGQSHFGLNIEGTIMKISVAGDLLWSNTYRYPNDSYDDYFYDFTQTKDSGFIIVGTCHPYTQDVWLLKLDEYGCLLPGCQLSTGIADIVDNDVPFLINPNPASDYFIVQRSQISKSSVSIAIYDALGRSVQSKSFPSEEHTIRFNTGNWLEGMYLVQMKKGDEQWIKKIMIVH